MSITREFNLPLFAGRSIPLLINANQYDSGETWIFTLLDGNGQKYTPSTGAIIGIKSDGHIIANSGTVNSDGQVVITETKQMTAAPGRAIFELVIDNESHGTVNFIVYVEPRPGENGIQSESDLSLFQETIDAVGDASYLVDEVAALSARMDTFTHLAEGSTTGDAELADIRVGYDGTVYNTAGDAVRDQIQDLHEELDTRTGTVTDVKILNTSLVRNQVANIPLATPADFGVIKAGINTEPGGGYGKVVSAVRAQNNEYLYIDAYYPLLMDEGSPAYNGKILAKFIPDPSKASSTTFGTVKVFENNEPPAGYVKVTDNNGDHYVPSIPGGTGTIRAKWLPNATSSTKGAVIVDTALSSTSANPVQNQAIYSALETKADTDGTYEDLTAGYAEVLTTEQHTTDTEPYVFRKSGGSATVGVREKDTIVGGSVAWNQLVQNGNFADGENGWTTSGTNTVSDGALTFTTGEEAFAFVLRQARDLYRNHKYLVSIEYKIASSASVQVRFSYNYASIASGIMMNINLAGVTPNVWQKESVIYGPNPSGDMPTTGFRIGFTSTNPFPANNSISFRNIVCYDLTQMFGSAVADAVYAMEQATAGSGVAWFKAMYPESYYAYSTGTMEHVHGLTSHDTTGLNQWDEEWEAGSYDTTTGAKVDNTGTIRCKNPIHVFPNTTYYLHIPSSPIVLYYDASGNYLTYGQPTANAVFTTPSNAHFINFRMGTAYGTTYKNDICINISSDKNGTYEPYTKHSYALDSDITLRGVPKWNNGLYYDGDTYEADGTLTRRYGVVDLGTLNWSYNSDRAIFYSNGLVNIIKRTSYTALGNLVCPKYVTVIASGNNGGVDKTISVGALITTDGINVKDSAYTDATAFKTAMSGVMLVYEVATPTTWSADPFTTPQIVDKYGTEAYVTTGLVAVGHDTKYLTDLKGKLEELPTIPSTPTTTGTYVLRATVTSSGVTYEWVAQ